LVIFFFDPLAVSEGTLVTGVKEVVKKNITTLTEPAPSQVS